MLPARSFGDGYVVSLPVQSWFCMADRGVVYLAVQQFCYLEAALISALALRALHPDLPITVVSDLPALAALPIERHGLEARLLPQPHHGSGLSLSRAVKTRIHTFSPHRDTLYLDADMLPVQPLTSLWNILEQDDLALVPDRLPEIGLCDHIAPEEVAFTLECLPASTRQFNSGLILWRRSATSMALFEAWHREWQRFARHDQLALARAIFTSQTPVLELPRHYNLSPRDAEPLLKRGEPATLLHCWAGKLTSGRFRRLAGRFCPQALEIADELLATVAESLLSA